MCVQVILHGIEKGRELPDKRVGSFEEGVEIRVYWFEEEGNDWVKRGSW